MRRFGGEHTQEAAAIDYMEDSHMLEVVVVAGKALAVKSSWAPVMRQLLLLPRQMGLRPLAIRRCPPPLESSS